MTTLHVHLQDGFLNQRVTLSVDGRVACEKPNVRTKPQLGLAATVELEVPEGAITVEVRLPDSGQSHTVALDAAATPFLGVSLGEDGSLTHKLSDTTFGYV